MDKIHQSTLRALEGDACPYKWNKMYIEKEIPKPDKEVFRLGLYFEGLILGSSSDGDKHGLDDKTIKSAKGVRIQEQAGIIKSLLFNKEDPNFLGFTDIESQVKISHKDMEGILDILGRRNGTKAICDIKLTGDATNTWGDYGWGNPEAMDMFQHVYYSYIYMNEYGELPDYYLLVADYSPRMNRKLLKLDIKESSFHSMLDRYQGFKYAVEVYSSRKEGFPKWPTPDNCKDCPLIKSCDKAYIEPIIQEELIEVK